MNPISISTNKTSGSHGRFLTIHKNGGFNFSKEVSKELFAEKSSIQFFEQNGIVYFLITANEGFATKSKKDSVGFNSVELVNSLSKHLKIGRNKYKRFNIGESIEISGAKYYPLATAQVLVDKLPIQKELPLQSDDVKNVRLTTVVNAKVAKHYESLAKKMDKTISGLLREMIENHYNTLNQST